MKQFFKTTFACILGVFIAGGILMFLSFFALIGMASMSEQTYTLKPKTILHIKLEGELVERAKENPWESILSDYQTNTMGLDEILAAIDVAKTDDKIIGIYLDASGMGFNAGTASLDEIRTRLNDFKTSGKFIISYGDQFSQGQYYLASVADKVIMNPYGMFDLHGLTSNHVFFKNVLEKLGIDVQVFRVGTFKSAVEPFIATQMSEANREQTSVYLNSIWRHLVSNIGQSRNLSAEQINQYADQMLALQEPVKTTEYHLIDSLMYRSQVENMLIGKADVKTIKDLNLATVKDIAPLKKAKTGAKQTIAVVYAVGEIDNGNGDGIDTKKLVKELNAIKADSTVKAVVMRVNSPGGSAYGSEQVWKAVEELKQVKPIAISMGDYAASGGYYISCNANRIFAHATTITGSIGIFGMIPSAENLMTKKIGFTFDEVKTNKYGNFPSFTKTMSADEASMMQAYVERGYALFTNRCADGRKINIDELRKIAEGRVWTGQNALELKLVDEIGDLNQAIEWVAGAAKLTDYNLVDYPRKKTFIEELFEQINSTAAVQMAGMLLGDEYKTFQLIKNIKQIDPIQARMETIEIR